MAEPESKPLLTSNYGATPTLQPHASLRSTGGRGKLRFAARQQMMKNKSADGLSRSHCVFKSIFTGVQRQNASRHITASSPKPVKWGNSGPNSLSIDREELPPVDETIQTTKHSYLYDTLNPKSSLPSAKLFQSFMTVIILLDALIYILSTEEDLSYLSYIFYIAEAVTSTIFAIEYFARLYVCGEKKCCKKYGPIRGRWKYMCTSQALVDAFATFPFFVELLSGVPLPTLTYLRVFRLLRITKTQSYSKAMGAVMRVLYFNREILQVAALLGVYLVIITSIMMYYLRPRGEDLKSVEDASDFSSIGSCMVLSTLMLTGQGGPSGDLPWYTQLVVLITGIFSVAMFAIPASMLTWGFEAEAERLGAHAKKRALAKRRGEEYESDTSSSSSASSCVSGFGDIR